MAQIVIEDGWRIVMADALAIESALTWTADFAAGPILIVDPRTNRPVAICRPVGEPGSAAAPPEQPTAPAPVALPEPVAEPGPEFEPVPPSVRPKRGRPSKAVPASIEKIDFGALDREKVADPSDTPVNGSLTEAQKEWLQREVEREPGASADWIGERFEAKYGRKIGKTTVQSYMIAAHARRRAGES